LKKYLTTFDDKIFKGVIDFFKNIDNFCKEKKITDVDYNVEYVSFLILKSEVLSDDKFNLSQVMEKKFNLSKYFFDKFIDGNNLSFKDWLFPLIDFYTFNVQENYILSEIEDFKVYAEEKVLKEETKEIKTKSKKIVI